MSFKIISGTNYCVTDVVEKFYLGHSVLRSSHVGNFDAITTALVQMGIPTLLHEYLSGAAHVYEPMYIKCQGSKKLISGDVGSRLALFSKNCEEDHSILYDHYVATHKIFKNTHLLSEFLLTQRVFVEDALEIIVDGYPSIFNLYVDDTGTKYYLNGSIKKGVQVYESYDGKRMEISTQSIPKLAIDFLRNVLRIANGESVTETIYGFVLNTEINLVLVTIVDLLNKANRDQEVTAYHLSGLKMFGYLAPSTKTAATGGASVMSRKIEFLYKILHQKLNYLPKKIQLVIVPTTPLVDYLSVNSRFDTFGVCQKYRDISQIMQFTQYDLERYDLVFNSDKYISDCCS